MPRPGVAEVVDVCEEEGVLVCVWLAVPVCDEEGVLVCVWLAVPVCEELDVPVGVCVAAVMTALFARYAIRAAI